jgi:UDP-glucuronate 4-epimerase
MKILVTGAAGFIGFHLSQYLCKRGDTVVGIDNMNDYYDVRIKEARLEKLSKYDNFSFIKMDLADRDDMADLFKEQQFDKVANLAAQAGVRYSLTNPHAYMDSNVIGFCNILEGCRHNNIKHLVYASSSSVYGANTNFPLSENDNIDHPVALYAASKKANEAMAHAYAHLYKLPCTGLRFFTVYGPWGRPDMALFKFVKNILEDKAIDVYNFGNMHRDFTYIDDIVEGVVRAIDHPAEPNADWSGENPDPATSYAPWRVYNIGNGNPVKLMDFIHAIEKQLGKTAEMNMLPMQAGDIPKTAADTRNLENDLGYRPAIGIEEGIKQFIDWYQEFYLKMPLSS